jgi:hypothetical protein
MEVLVKHGLLRARTEVNEWIMPGGEDMSMPPDGYAVSFVPFHKRGFVVPHRFF